MGGGSLPTEHNSSALEPADKEGSERYFYVNIYFVLYFRLLDKRFFHFFPGLQGMQGNFEISEKLTMNNGKYVFYVLNPLIFPPILRVNFKVSVTGK